MPLEPDNSALPEATFLTGGSEMAAEILGRDWSDTPLGPISTWPQSLRTTVSLCLASNFPINIIWGPQHSQIYNDGYRVLCGEKHPASLGMDYTECWASAWSALSAPFEAARQGRTSFLENQRMFLFRNGYLEETFFTFSLSPIRDESGNIGGLFHPVTETTPTMLSERRTRALRDLTAQLGNADSRAGLCRQLVETLAQFELDLPFVLLYEFDADGGDYRLAGETGVQAGTVLAPHRLALDDAAIWPMPAVMTAGATLRMDGLRERFGQTPCGPYPEAPDTAFALPVGLPGSRRPEMLVVAGASARLPLDDAYAGFYDLLRATVSAALTRVNAAEAERQRADMLAAIDRAKTVFFSNVSHEFRTPLTLMLGPLEEALQDDLTAPQRARLDIANRNALRLLRLVNSLLDFSRIEAGRIDAAFVPTDLAQLTADLASNFRAACEKAGLVYTVDCAPLHEAVFVDPAMWETIVLNLLSNAFKFTLAGAIEVTLREADGMAELQVLDTGAGIPPADLEHVFDRFHRAEGQGGRSVEGSGIGLSLVRELVQLHGGTIAVASTPGQGTRFTLRLPFGRDHLAPHQRVSTEAAGGAGNGAQRYVDEAMGWLPDEVLPAADEHGVAPPIHRGRVVLADDNADMRAYIKRVLEEGGHEVVAVANGRQALDTVRAVASAGALPDLVLSDVMMPELDGFALLAALRADPATSGVLILLLSARAGEEARLEGLNAGADDYLVKPFGARELRARVDGAVTLARQRRAAAVREQDLLLEVETARGKSALVDSQAHAVALFEQSTVGMAEGSLDGILLNVNQRYADMIGLPREEIVGRRVDAFLHPEDAPDNRALFGALVGQGVPYELENRFLRPDGQVLWVGKTVTPVRSRNGGPATVLAVYMDITARKQAEAALHEAARRKDEFLAMLAHELRNPLAPIRAAAEMMGMAQLDATRSRRVSEIIGRQVRHMTALIDDLLDVSRVTRGLVDIAKAPQDVPAIVANAVEQVRPLIESQRHQLVLKLDPAGGRVLGDEKRLVQILTNLLNNAAKYTPAGGAITLCTEAEPEHIDIIIRDTGIGIAPALRAHVFDLFAQAERTPDRAQGGLGLGLALVKSLVELHGGRVACHSAGLGKGSTFIVQLPRMAEDGGADAAGPAIAAPQGNAGPLDILVVDDNADAAFMLKLLLEQWGHRVRVEHDALRALDSAAIQAPDVALLDIGLPGLDGNGLAQRLRANPATAGIALVAVTGYGQELDRQRALEAGFDHHLVKPVNTAELAAVLDGVRTRS